MKRIIIPLCILLWCSIALQAREYLLTSPDGRTLVTVIADDFLYWKVSRDGVPVIVPSEMSMTLSDGTVFGHNPKVRSFKISGHDGTFGTQFYHKAEVRDCYHSLTLDMKGGYGVEFRAYDSGVAYRFTSSRSDRITVLDEKVSFNFDRDYEALVPYVTDNRAGERYCYSFESYYTESHISEMFDDSLSTVPLLVELDSGKKAAIMDAGAEDYPGMFLKLNSYGRRGLVAEFAPCPLETRLISGNIVPVKRTDYIVETSGTRVFPWRVAVISDRDADLMDNDLMQCLSPECRLDDTSWIHPGKASWNYWSNFHITGVDFRAGMNAETFKYFVDFSAANHLEYVLIDAGWNAGDIMVPLRGLDLDGIVKYAAEKGVGILLWCLWSDIIDRYKTVFPYYAEAGIKGFKVDFVDSDDQAAVRMMYDLAAAAASNHLIIDFHGMKANGMQRTYPNVISFEGVKGLENSSFVDVFEDVPVDDIPRYDVSAPFIRMLTGPMDYTPGAMDNSIRCAYRPVGTNPMSMGTRVHQMAMYIIYDSPLQMMADSPSKYIRERECAEFISKIPTVFDRTLAIDGEVGEYVVMAREKRGVWYLSALTSWTPRDISVSLDFLGQGVWNAEVFSDGINADLAAEDYSHRDIEVVSSDTLAVHLAPGGGWSAIISRQL